MALSGVRPGKLVALKWSDIDWESETFDVKRTRIRGESGPTKTNERRGLIFWTTGTNLAPPIIQYAKSPKK